MGENSDQLTKMMQAFQTFGLNIIQSMGEMKSIIERLEKRIEFLETLLIKIKGFEISFQELSAFREHLDSELLELKSLIKANAVKQTKSFENSQITPKDKFATIDHPKEIFTLLQDLLNTCTSASAIAEYLAQAKDRMFVLTGGHIVLFDMQRTIQSIKNNVSPFQEQIPAIREKINSWIAMFS
jgi:hypothetical protein